MGFYIVATIFTILLLLNNFKLDARKHEKAKAFHFIVITIAGVYFANSFRVLGWAVIHFDKTIDKFYTSLGWIMPTLNFTLFVVQLALSLVASVQFGKMINRDRKAKNLMLRLLPFLAISEAFSFYRSYAEYGLAMEGAFLGFVLGFFFYSLLALGIYRLYTRQFMIDFFVVGKSSEKGEITAGIPVSYELYWKDNHVGTLTETDHKRTGNVVYNPDFQNTPEHELLAHYIQHSIQASNYLENEDLENYNKMGVLESSFSELIDSREWVLIVNDRRIAVVCPIFHENNQVSWQLD